MRNGQNNLLGVLKRELEFWNSGGYRKPSWRAQFIFQDSPTCMNRDNPEHPKPCSECVLMPLVPTECRGNKIPCRQIPLDDQGNTIDDFYRWGTWEELEDGFGAWLAKQIRDLESKQTGTESVTGANRTQKQLSAKAA